MKTVTLVNSRGSTLTYTPQWGVLWNGKKSQRYFMNRALALARRMRARGHSVNVIQFPK